MNTELIESIKASRKLGVKEYFIRQALSDMGWEREAIDTALNAEEAWPSKSRVDFTGDVVASANYKVKNAFRGKTHRVSLIVFLVVISLLGAVTFWAISKYQNSRYPIVLPSSESDLSFEYGSWPALENAQFFDKVKSQFIAQATSFIESDLSEMVLRVYTNGKLETEVPILSKGKEGSWWETPAGLYQIQGKETNHFSSFGQVNMPWSMPFQGNFFIHGWPYYPNGTPVPEGYSGGCIRLADQDAKQIYDLAKTGMPVLVHEKDFSEDGFEYELLGKNLEAPQYLGADLKSNFVFARQDSDKEVPIASITKLMTAIIATEYINIEKEVSISSGMLTQTSKPRLYAGQRVSVFNLLYPLLMESSNEAGTAIAAILGESRFVDLMNSKAKAIGMDHTVFVDPNGIGANNVSTAADLFQLAKYLYNNRSFVLDISNGGALYSVYGPPIWKGLENFNVFSSDPDFVGGKVGMTQAAGETIISIFDISIEDETRPIVVIALGTNNRARDAAALIDYIRRSY